VEAGEPLPPDAGWGKEHSPQNPTWVFSARGTGTPYDPQEQRLHIGWALRGSETYDWRAGFADQYVFPPYSHASLYLAEVGNSNGERFYHNNTFEVLCGDMRLVDILSNRSEEIWICVPYLQGDNEVEGVGMVFVEAGSYHIEGVGQVWVNER
jgi:hypothetical protein